MQNLSVIFLTANETPVRWAKYHFKVLKDAIGDSPLITISRKPMEGALLDTEKKSYTNIYRQMLRGAKVAKTKYVAIAEDDVLYSREHFEFYRPALDTFAYNMNRWALFTWGEPVYSMRNRKSNCSLIAPRELMIEALEERFAKYDEFPAPYAGELGRERCEAGLGVTMRKSVEVFSEVPIIHFNHPDASEERQKRGRKKLGQVKAYDIPYWGRAEDLIKLYV